MNEGPASFAPATEPKSLTAEDIKLAQESFNAAPSLAAEIEDDEPLFDPEAMRKTSEALEARASGPETVAEVAPAESAKIIDIRERLERNRLVQEASIDAMRARTETAPITDAEDRPLRVDEKAEFTQLLNRTSQGMTRARYTGTRREQLAQALKWRQTSDKSAEKKTLFAATAAGAASVAAAAFFSGTALTILPAVAVAAPIAAGIWGARKLWSKYRQGAYKRRGEAFLAKTGNAESSPRAQAA